MAEDTPTPAPSGPEESVPTSAAAPTEPVATESATPVAVSEPSELDGLAALDQVSIEELLKQASFEDPVAVGLPQEGASGSNQPPPNVSDFKLPNFQQVMKDAQVSSIDLLRDVELNVKIELGRSRMFVEDVLKLSEGSVVELDKLAGDPVDVFVNDRLVARGEVLVLNDNFCVRVNEIVAGIKEEGF